MSAVHLITEYKGAGRLGRHYEAPPLRSRVAAGARSIARAFRPLVSRTWHRYLAPFDQGDLGSCTANAFYGCLATDPFYHPGLIADQHTIQGLYAQATRLDTVPGHWPPTDSGSTGAAACRAGERAGLTSGHRSIFSLNGSLDALGYVGPIMTGITWYDSFDVPIGPGARLDISPNAAPRGGHEVEVSAVDCERRLIRGPQSWGEDWGDHGYWTMSWDTFARLLSERGDVKQPVPLP